MHLKSNITVKSDLQTQYQHTSSTCNITHAFKGHIGLVTRQDTVRTGKQVQSNENPDLSCKRRSIHIT